jgi:hypothetical protein
MRKPFFAVLLCLSIISCKRESQPGEQHPPSAENAYTSSDDLKTTFAGALAKAMKSEKVRSILKEEAIRQFDNDYDVLFQLVKDKEITPGVTLSGYLSQLSGVDFERFSEEAPLLTILIPELHNFSANTWNTANEVPVVAIVKNNRQERLDTMLTAFDSNGKTLLLPSNREPGQSVVVVKENERITNRQAVAEGRLVNDNFVFQNKTTSFYFIDESFKGKQTTQVTNASRISLKSTVFDSKLVEAALKKVPSQRDYIYYNIQNQTDQGTLDDTYMEYIYAIYMNGDESVSSIYDDATTDWSDGALEFQIDVIFFNSTSSLDKITKVISAPRNSLMQASDGSVLAYVLPTPVPLVTWDVQKMGDTWKYVINEVDPGTVTTSTYTSSTKFGANFSASGDIKMIKLGLGLTGEKTSTSTTQVQVTTGSDFCGEAVNYFTNAIAENRNLWFLYLNNVINTGTVGLIVAPGKIK